jgi:hypothetical protein
MFLSIGGDATVFLANTMSKTTTRLSRWKVDAAMFVLTFTRYKAMWSLNFWGVPGEAYRPGTCWLSGYVPAPANSPRQANEIAAYCVRDL